MCTNFVSTITIFIIEKYFVDLDVGDAGYNNMDFYKGSAQRMRYLLATMDMSPGDSYADFEGNPKQLKLGQEDNRFYNCIVWKYRFSNFRLLLKC